MKAKKIKNRVQQIYFAFISCYSVSVIFFTIWSDVFINPNGKDTVPQDVGLSSRVFKMDWYKSAVIILIVQFLLDCLPILSFVYAHYVSIPAKIKVVKEPEVT